MQTLGLSDSTPRTENRLKSLFWPDIKTGSDADYIGAQGYWICTIVAIISFLLLTLSGKPVIALVSLYFYYFGGVGVRERDRYSAVVMFVVFVLDVLISPFSVVRTILTILLLSNVRATWIAHQWRAGSGDAEIPSRMAETVSDKFVDVLPGWLWPGGRYPYYIISAFVLLMGVIGTITRVSR